MSIYTFRKDDAIRFAEECGIKKKIVGDELHLWECPYCHSRKDHNTFSINLQTGQFKCLRASCGAHGNMLTLHRDFNFDLGTDVSEYERPRYSWRRFKKPEKPIESDDVAIRYLTGRGISESVIKKYEIKSKKDNDNLIAFPFFDESGNLDFIKYRYIKPPDGKGKEFCESGCRAILFGMKQCNPDNQTLIITEGQIDSLSVVTAGYENAVSVPLGKNGMTWFPHCFDWLHNFTTVIVFGDYEHGSMTLLDDIRSRFTWSAVKAVQPESYRGCKDANDILRKFGVDAIRAAVDNAKPIMLPEVMELSDVPYDNDDAEKLPTGIRDIDNLLEGGLSFGYFDILTGKRGDGKSTFSTMILKSAIDNNIPCFVYSGEMKCSDVRKTLDRQIAGPERIRDLYEGSNMGFHKFDLSEPNREVVGMYYKDVVYIYNTQKILIDEKPDLLKIVETYITQFGCKFILLDNLMTLIDVVSFEGVTKYEKQELVCKALARMAQMYNVIILLIAHKKKTDPKYQGDQNDDVLGSSEITNLAGCILSYERGGSDLKDSQRKIKITKERTAGHTNFDGITVNYDEKSKRVFGNNQMEINAAKLDGKCFSDNISGNDNDNNLPADFESVEDETEVPF